MVGTLFMMHYYYYHYYSYYYYYCYLKLGNNCSTSDYSNCHEMETY